MGMASEALLSYGTDFRNYIRRTRMHNRAFARATEIVLGNHPNTNMLIQMGGDFSTYWKRKSPGVLYAVFTDHTNMLSKRLPDFGMLFPERSVIPTWNQVEREVFSQQDLIFVVGRHVKQSMIDDYGVPSARVSVVGAGPNLDVDIERDGIEKNYAAKNILFVGLDAARKGLGALRKAFAKVRQVHPDANLNIVGLNGDNEEGVRYYGKLKGEPLKELFYDSQIFAMPSLREPFGIVFLEAMWSKAVCIGTSIEAIPEIIKDGETGYIVDPNDDGALAERISALFSHPEDLKDKAERGYAVAKSEWRWDLTAKKIRPVRKQFEFSPRVEPACGARR
jgi:glycosyltransferase involved in cell wall biosynthesis